MRARQEPGVRPVRRGPIMMQNHSRRIRRLVASDQLPVRPGSLVLASVDRIAACFNMARRADGRVAAGKCQ